MIGAPQCILSAREMGQYTETKWHCWQPALSWKTGQKDDEQDPAIIGSDRCRETALSAVAHTTTHGNTVISREYKKKKIQISISPRGLRLVQARHTSPSIPISTCIPLSEHVIVSQTLLHWLLEKKGVMPYFQHWLTLCLSPRTQQWCRPPLRQG